MTQSFEHIEVVLESPVARIRLNRPAHLNALSKDLQEEIDAALTQIAADEEARVVVISGNGRAFCSGFEMSGDEAWEAMHESPAAGTASLEWDSDWLGRIWSFPKPTIAAVHGYALGGGCELAMVCDVTVAAAGTKLGEPEIRFSNMPVNFVLPFVIGMKAAKDLLLTGRLVDAEEALRLGMVTAVVPEAELDRRVDAYAQTMARISPLALRTQKESLNRSYELSGYTAAAALNIKLCGILDTTNTEEMARFNEIRRAEGLRAALDWRDSTFQEADALFEPAAPSC